MTDGIYKEGTIIDGRYRIERRLGRGGFATVYEAEHLQLGRKAALKVLEPVAPHITERFQARFNTEARIAANLDHPNVVRIFDFGFIDNGERPYMAMEKLQGRDLEQWLEDEGSMEPQRAKRLFLPVLDALRIGHERGIVHKDLKPSNLFFVKEGTPDERLVVLDYGIARLEGDDNPRYTEEGTYTGTPAYMPPEYIHRREVTPAYDVYQIGLIFIEAMTGQPVVKAGSQIAYMVAHVEGQHRIPEGFTDTALGASLVKAISVDPADRYSDAGQMLDAVRIAEVSAGTDFTLPAIVLDDLDQARITNKEQRPPPPTDEYPPRQPPPKQGLGLGAVIGILALLALFGCGAMGLVASAWFFVEDEMAYDDYDPMVDPMFDPNTMDTPSVPNMPNMPRIAMPDEAGQEMNAWLLSRYMIMTTLNQVRLYEDILGKTGGWGAGGASFVPSGTEDLLQLATDQMQIGFESNPDRPDVERAAKALQPDFARLRSVLSDLYDYHSVKRGWEADKGAHGKELTKQLLSTTQKLKPKYDTWSRAIDAALQHHLAQQEDRFARDPFMSAATRAMAAQAHLITAMGADPKSAKSNEALSKFDKELDRLESAIKQNSGELQQRYSITSGLHSRYLSSLKDTRKQAGELRSEADRGKDVSGDLTFLWMQLHSTFASYNSLGQF